MTRTETALIGCGRIGFILEHDPLRYKPCTHYGGMTAAGLTVTSACDISQERLSAFARMSGLSAGSCFSDYRRLLKKRQPEIIVISTWIDSHYNIAIDAIRNGVKIIILEKPVTPHLLQAQKILTESEKYGCRIIINHERRFDSRYIKIRDMISCGRIGEIRSVNARILTGQYRGKSHVDEGGGPLLHDGTHLLDIIRFLFGDIKSVQGQISRFERSSGFEDSASAWLVTETGIDIFLEAGGGRKYFLFELEIWGTEGKITIGNGFQRLFMKHKSSMYTGFNDLSEEKFPSIKRNNCFSELYRHVKKIIKGTETKEISGIIDGYRALEAVHAVYRSSEIKGGRIILPIKPRSINLKRIFNLDQI